MFELNHRCWLRFMHLSQNDQGLNVLLGIMSSWNVAGFLHTSQLLAIMLLYFANLSNTLGIGFLKGFGESAGLDALDCLVRHACQC